MLAILQLVGAAAVQQAAIVGGLKVAPIAGPSTAEPATELVSWIVRHDVFEDIFRNPPDAEKAMENLSFFSPRNTWGWLAFFLCLGVLVVVDAKFLRSPSGEKMELGHAGKLIGFWILMGLVFNLIVWALYDMDTAVMWFNGYLIEYFLSVDNLFVFHLVFRVYSTPKECFHTALMWGIVGAVVFRLVFFLAFSVALYWVQSIRVVFGISLIWMGLQSAFEEQDEEDEPAKACESCTGTGEVEDSRCSMCNGSGYTSDDFLVNTALKCIPITPRYVGASFFVQETNRAGKEVWRATLLFVVVMTLELTDIIFAVDSVSVKVSQIPDAFITYTSSIFAMLGLRAMFFVVDAMEAQFWLLKYGLCFVFCFIGSSLVYAQYVEIPATRVCLILVGSLVVTAVLSVYVPKPEGKADTDGESSAGESRAEAEDQPLAT
mmetsp:Transcript_24375/g.59135  ORF Transcript_24375/g.59135 Transcript_24375/m.59135 type:complete len:433 (+) Transcript_24375:68-1366(+)